MINEPTDDEREALRRVSWMVEGPYEDIEYRLDRTGEIDAILAAGFRRTGVSEPSVAPILSCSCPCHTTPGYSHIAACCTVDPQGEPSDAQAEALKIALEVGERESRAAGGSAAALFSGFRIVSTDLSDSERRAAYRREHRAELMRQERAALRAAGDVR